MGGDALETVKSEGHQRNDIKNMGKRKAPLQGKAAIEGRRKVLRS